MYQKRIETVAYVLIAKTSSPSGTCPTTSSQFDAGARNQSAPAADIGLDFALA